MTGLQPDLDAVTARVVESAGADAIDPVVVRFLLVRYAATGRDDLSGIVGESLARGLVQHTSASDAAARAEWLLLFVDALAWSEDDRLIPAAAATLASIDRDASPAAIDASLRGAATLDDAARVSARIDDLERLVARTYEPGEGLAEGDEFGVASALLTAYDVTGRLPYPMLAEELVQHAQRYGRDADDLATACIAARVLCRLHALRADDDYVRAAVLAPNADYAADAARLLTAHASRALARGRDAAVYGLALAQWLGLH